MNEYELLRAEIIEDYNGIRQYENILYTVVAAILVFTLGADFFVLCLIPYIVIIPVFYIVMSTKDGICKIATYMMTFLEEDQNNYHWETRHYEFDKMLDNGKGLLKWKTHSQYYLLSIACSASSIVKIFQNKIYSLDSKVGLTCAITTFTLWILTIIYRNTFNYSSEKEAMLAKWKEIKNSEKIPACTVLMPKP